MEPSTIVASFKEPADADRAVEVLRRHGFDSDSVGLVGHRGSDDPVIDTATGSAGGGVTGGVIGAVAAGLIPGVGPLIAAGLLASTLAGAAIGATVGGLAGSLTSLGLSDEDAAMYAHEFDSGSTLVVVRAQETERARALLSAEGAEKLKDFSQAATDQSTFRTEQ